MISCIYPECNYQVLESQTPKLYQHIKASHKTGHDRRKSKQTKSTPEVNMVCILLLVKPHLR